MKMVTAIIKPSKLPAVKEALSDKEIFRLTVSEVQGYGQQKGIVEVYRGQEFEVNLISKVKIEIAVNDEFVQPCIDAISSAAKTGEIGDGKIFVMPLENVVRIRTGDQGGQAI